VGWDAIAVWLRGVGLPCFTMMLSCFFRGLSWPTYLTHHRIDVNPGVSRSHAA
jgi:hypothetical protein